MKYGLFGLSMIVTLLSHAQNGSIGMGTENPNPHAVLDLTAPNHNQGFLVPRLANLERNDSTFMAGLDMDDNSLLVYDSTEHLFYYWVDTTWVAVASQRNVSPWTRVGADLQYTSGEVGIGVTPEKIFHVKNTTGNAIIEIEGGLNSLANSPGIRLTEEFGSDFGMEMLYDGFANRLKFRTITANAVSVDNILQMTTAGDVFVTAGDITMQNQVITPTSANVITVNTNGTVLTAGQISSRVINVQSTAGGVRSVTGIAPGTDGQQLVFVGTSTGTNGVQFASPFSDTAANKVIVAGGFVTVGQYDVLELIYNGALQSWVQVSYSNNSLQTIP